VHFRCATRFARLNGRGPRRSGTRCSSPQFLCALVGTALRRLSSGDAGNIKKVYCAPGAGAAAPRSRVSSDRSAATSATAASAARARVRSGRRSRRDQEDRVAELVGEAESALIRRDRAVDVTGRGRPPKCDACDSIARSVSDQPHVPASISRSSAPLKQPGPSAGRGVWNRCSNPGGSVCEGRTPRRASAAPAFSIPARSASARHRETACTTRCRAMKRTERQGLPRHAVCAAPPFVSPRWRGERRGGVTPVVDRTTPDMRQHRPIAGRRQFGISRR